MALDSTGRYHMNPQVARMHDRAPSLKAAVPHAPKPKEPDGGDEPMAEHRVHHMEFHHHPSGGGKIRSVAHHEDGTQEEREHENAHEAADHLAESMSGEDTDDLGQGEPDGDEQPEAAMQQP